jgi:hypothetical protein
VLHSLLESKILSQVPEEDPSAEMGVDFKAFSELLAKIPRVCGERLKWARTLRLEEVLARHLPKDNIFDELKHLREIPFSERRALAERLTAKVSAILTELILEKLDALSQSDIDPSAEALTHSNSKFCHDGASVGRFATLDDFYQCPEALIATTNPRVEVGMEIEHCHRENRDESSRRPTTTLRRGRAWKGRSWWTPRRASSTPTHPATRRNGGPSRSGLKQTHPVRKAHTDETRSRWMHSLARKLKLPGC